MWSKLRDLFRKQQPWNSIQSEVNVATRNPLVAVGDKTLLQALPGMYNGTLTLSLHTPDGGVAPVGAQVELWLSSNDGKTFYKPLLRDPTTQLDVDYVETLDQAGWCEAIGVTHFEVRLAALVGGGPVFANVQYRRN